MNKEVDGLGLKSLRTLRNRKSPGVDKDNSEVIKTYSDIIFKIRFLIFSTYANSHSYPPAGSVVKVI